MLTSKLITNIKRRITMPANQRLMENSDILSICDTVIMEKMVPEIISLRQNYFVLTSDIALTSGVDTYSIPYRAIGRTLRDLKLKYSDGTKKDLTLIDIEDEHYLAVGISTPDSFYFKGDKIVLSPPPSSGFTLEIWWEMPPSSLVDVTSSAKVLSVTGDDVTVDAVPSNLTISTQVDFISSIPGYSTYAYDRALTNIVGTTLSFATGSLSALTITAGDYISLIETSPLVQLPRECMPFLETLASRRILQAIGDFEGLKMLGEDNDDDLKQMRRLLEPRIRGEATKIINRKGLLRGVHNRNRILY